MREMSALQTLQRLLAGGVTSKRIRLAVDSLRRRLTGITDPLTEVRIYSDGPQIRADFNGATMDPLSGQLLLDFQNRARTLTFPERPAKNDEAVQKKRAEAEMWFERALAMEQAGATPPEVRAAYEKAVECDPTSTGALVNLGTLYFNQRNLAKAEDFYRRALKVDPNYALAHFNLGNLHDEKGDRDTAQHHYQRALEINPSYSDAHYNLALLYQNAGQPLKAVPHWRTYLKLDPHSSWAEIARRELEKLKEAAIVK
jgi:tetratricopeptide (TPR) repeat protein